MWEALSHRRILAAILLGAVGFLVNLLHVEIFFNVDFIFGSAFVMLVILHAGLWPGVLAALIAGSATWVLWNHPWAMVIFVSEAVCVGWLVRRRSWDILLADILFWSVLGAPLVWGFYHHVLHTQVQTTVLIILKQAVNGIINTLLAYLFHIAWRTWTRSAGKPRPAFRSVVFVAMVSLVTFPALLFLVVYVRRGTHQEEQLLARHGAELNRIACQTLRGWIEDRHKAIIALAALAARPDANLARQQQAVEIVRATMPAFKRVGVLDAKTDVIAYSPLVDEEGRSTLGRNFSDRPYLPTLRATLRPHVGDVVMGRIGPPLPMLPLLAPIVRGGRYEGYCIGITDTDHVQELLLHIVGQSGAQAIVLDRDDQVVCSTRKDLAPMSKFQPPAGEIRTLGEGARHWIPLLKPGSSRMQRWKNSLLIQEGRLSPQLPWKVRVESPFAPLIDSLTRISLFGMGILYALILVTVTLAHLFSHGFTESIARLEEATRAFPALLHAETGASLALPSSGIEEIHHLNGRFQQMADALQASFQELHLLKDTLEERVVARTEELQTALDTLKTLHGIIPICASCKKIRDDKGLWNQLEAYISQHADADFSHGICPECAERLYPDTHGRGLGS